jgi:hypothetical protein
MLPGPKTAKGHNMTASEATKAAPIEGVAVSIDHETKEYFVTAKDGPRTFFLAGPYESLGLAESKVDSVRRIACNPERNSSFGRAYFMGYGVTAVVGVPSGMRVSLGRI